jgi:hypothetical protein
MKKNIQQNNQIKKKITNKPIEKKIIQLGYSLIKSVLIHKYKQIEIPNRSRKRKTNLNNLLLLLHVWEGKKQK